MSNDARLDGIIAVILICRVRAVADRTNDNNSRKEQVTERNQQRNTEILVDVLVAVPETVLFPDYGHIASGNTVVKKCVGHATVLIFLKNKEAVRVGDVLEHHVKFQKERRRKCKKSS